jgi:protein PhnA
MNIEKELQQRSEMKCELCGGTSELAVLEVQPVTTLNPETTLYACQTCRTQIENPEKMDANHWRCLNESMWSTVPAVQVLAWRMLNRLRAEGWPQDLLDMLYLDDDTLAWAHATGEGIADEDVVKHIDSNGAILNTGDTVTLIKDLDVKGANFTAKRGTTVKNIRLVEDNSEQIEGKVDGQQIVILTKFVKKA